MRTKICSVFILTIVFAAQQALACPFCYGAKDGKSTQHMAVAIWFLFGAVLSVMGGIGAFGFHLWRHGRMPVGGTVDDQPEKIARQSARDPFFGVDVHGVRQMGRALLPV